MKVYIKGRNKEIDAVGEYNLETGELTVLKGSKVSPDISDFKGSKSILKHRDGYVEKNIVIKDRKFTSSSTAANFVTGRSTNGLITWRNSDGVVIKKMTDKN